MSNSESTDPRDGIVAYLAKQIVGPWDGPEEVIDDLPHRKYLMGTLYPQNASTAEVIDMDEADGPGGSVGEELADDPVRLANEWLPSSVGVTFYVGQGESIVCRLHGGAYETISEGRSRRWRRIELGSPAQPEIVVLQFPASSGRVRPEPSPCFGGRAEVRSFWRPMPQGWLVTVTLVNAQVQEDPTSVDPDRCLLQVGFDCTPVGSGILEYPSVDFLTSDLEEQELQLLHRHVVTFAMGHGCAAVWDEHGRIATRVATELLPTFTVPAVEHGGQLDDDVLYLRRLAEESIPVDQLQAELTGFVERYAAWVENLASANADIDRRLHPARDRLLQRLNVTVARLRRGVQVLVGSDRHLDAFRLANRVMAMQMRHSRDDSLAASRRSVDEPPSFPTDYDGLDYKWRPFQLAYIILVLPGVADENDPEREVVDLIWFPTGGGKTEAYLAVAAFQIFLRRIRSGNRGAGVAVLTRYTLRLLTTQQFQRAAAMVCAAELLRRQHESSMGSERITIGLWVGDEAAPNRFQKALELRDEVLNDPEPSNPFQLETCPWCGTEIIPRRQSDEVHYGIRAANDSFTFFCPAPSCPFHDRLPVAVVDDELYLRPPTILIATVDKFARLAWEEGGRAFFGSADREPPSLIIQDELHLLSGPLGTTVGIYESAIETLATFHGAKPKILSSTATIRRADEQVAGLFGRSVHLFPPAGLDARDSYFSRISTTAPGRRYVGVMSQSHTSSTTMINVAAALLQAPVDESLPPDELDAYWTLVAYHNSLRELGRTVTQARDDIPKRLETIAHDQSKARRLDDHTVVELTSNVGGTELPGRLARLALRHDDPDSVSFLASTNMLSVGVDVPRLGLMLVHGQPKTTSEYIQATSRVGRGRVPGLVVTMYSATRPRDRSHYESFVPFHEALYQRVEPTSVTPYSLPSRERALHAALVILVRHGVGLAANDRAGAFDSTSPDVQRAIEILKERVAAVDPGELEVTERHLRRLVAQWDEAAALARGAGRSLYYRAPSKQHAALLQDFGGRRDSWETLQSMRNVDRQCTIHVIGED
jgi:hypothetical protein